MNHPYAIGLATLTEGNAAWLDGRLPAGEVLAPAAATVPRERLGGLAPQ